MPDQNKTVMLCNRMAFSYTGMAVLQTKQTSVWLWEVIQELKDRCSTKAVIDHIAKRADIAVARTNRSHYPNDSDLRHAFVGVGWVQLPGASNLSPMLVRITNYHDPTGREMAIPRSEFHIQRIMIPDREYRLMETGTNQTPREREQLNARIKKHAKSKNGLPATLVMHLLSNAIWKVHRRAKNKVSDNLLVVCIPCAAAERHRVNLFTSNSGPRAGFSLINQGCKEADEPLLPEHMAQFAYIPSALEGPTQHAPLLACPGMGAVSSFTYETM